MTAVNKNLYYFKKIKFFGKFGVLTILVKERFWEKWSSAFLQTGTLFIFLDYFMFNILPKRYVDNSKNPSSISLCLMLPGPLKKWKL